MVEFPRVVSQRKLRGPPVISFSLLLLGRSCSLDQTDRACLSYRGFVKIIPEASPAGVPNLYLRIREAVDRETRWTSRPRNQSLPRDANASDRQGPKNVLIVEREYAFPDILRSLWKHLRLFHVISLHIYIYVYYLITLAIEWVNLY